MTQRDIDTAGRPPVALGCSLAVLAVVVGVLFVGGCIAFVESGADSGKVVLRDADSYEFASVDYQGENNFFLVRTPQGEFVAFSDLDAANRSNPSRQCRANLVRFGDPAHARITDDFGERFSRESGGSQIIFREACNDAVYDLAGIRLDADARNLDQFSVTIDRQNRVVVDVSRRICTSRDEREFRLSTTC